jgi:hypothetical protein
MATSEKQLAANRKNSEKSTGPQTTQGKGRTSQNARKHGLRAATVLGPEEDERKFAEFHEALRRDCQPVGELEELLVGRLVGAAWRLLRVNCLEAYVMSTDHETLTDDLATTDNLGKLGRYETQIERSFYRALHELQRLQAARQGERVPPPLVADVDVPHSTPDSG